MANTREQLLQREDIPDEDVDDLIGIAAELQANAEADAETATLEEIQAVAAELDIKPEYIESALSELTRRRQNQRKVELQQSENRRLGLWLAVTVALVGAAVMGGNVVAAQQAASNVRAAAINLDNAESYVDIVLDRQAALVPQLVALSGGDGTQLDTHVHAMRDAQTLEERLEKSRELDLALTRQLAQLPAPADDTAAITRLNLTHELTGIQNRLSAERSRVARARDTYQRSLQQPGAGLARTLGLIEER